MFCCSVDRSLQMILSDRKCFAPSPQSQLFYSEEDEYGIWIIAFSVLGASASTASHGAPRTIQVIVSLESRQSPAAHINSVTDVESSAVRVSGSVLFAIESVITPVMCQWWNRRRPAGPWAGTSAGTAPGLKWQSGLWPEYVSEVQVVFVLLICFSVGIYFAILVVFYKWSVECTKCTR